MTHFTPSQLTLIALAVREKLERHAERHGFDSHYWKLRGVLSVIERPNGHVEPSSGLIPIGALRLEDATA